MTTLLDLRTQARQRADMEHSTFITDSELTTYLNQSAFELYDLLVSAYGDDYFVAAPPPTFTTDGTTEVYPAPANLYKLLGVDISASGAPGTWRTLVPFGINERNLNPWGRTGSNPAPVYADPRYRLSGSNIWFEYAPAGGQTVRVLHIPRMTPLAADTDDLDGISGWDEYVIVDAAIKMKQKEQSDAAELMATKNALRVRIERMKQHRTAGQPKTTQRTRRNVWGFDAPGLPGGRGPWGY